MAIALYFAILEGASHALRASWTRSRRRWTRPTWCATPAICGASPDKTQFIVITHRRGTMEEADVLYGVTMQERGVSQVLAMDLNAVETELHHARHLKWGWQVEIVRSDDPMGLFDKIQGSIGIFHGF